MPRRLHGGRVCAWFRAACFCRPSGCAKVARQPQIEEHHASPPCLKLCVKSAKLAFAAPVAQPRLQQFVCLNVVFTYEVHVLRIQGACAPPCGERTVYLCKISAQWGTRGTKARNTGPRIPPSLLRRRSSRQTWHRSRRQSLGLRLERHEIFEKTFR